jgi:hypothetical protein
MVEPDDYQNKPYNGSNAYQYTATIVTGMMAAGYEQGANYMIWDTVSNKFTFTEWQSYIQPTIIANRSTYPLNSARPSNLP